jgi:hypothetical protein
MGTISVRRAVLLTATPPRNRMEMIMQSWVSARGLTGRIYRYLPLGRWDDWLNVPANYGFGYLTGGLAPYWHILYFGEAVNIRDRMLGHERWLEAFNLGATHVLAHVSSSDEVVRRAEERDLIQSHNPVLNVQHRTTNALADLLCSNPLGLGSLGSALGFGLGSPWPSGKL